MSYECPTCGQSASCWSPRPDGMLNELLAKAALRDLHGAIVAIAKYGFDKDTTKDPEAFQLWRALNDAQAKAAKVLKL